MPLSYLPEEIQSAVKQQDRMTDQFQNYSTRFNNYSDQFDRYADTLNDVGISNLLRYGEVEEGDLVGQAVTDNTLAYNKAYDQAVRDMTRMGINPNSGRFAGMGQSYALNRAAAEAGARNQARLQARNENFQRANTLAGLGYNYSSMGMNAANAALNGLNAAANNNLRVISTLGQAEGIGRNRQQQADQVRYGTQLLGNRWGGTDTQALIATNQALNPQLVSRQSQALKQSGVGATPTTTATGNIYTNK